MKKSLMVFAAALAAAMMMVAMPAAAQPDPGAEIRVAFSAPHDLGVQAAPAAATEASVAMATVYEPGRSMYANPALAGYDASAAKGGSPSKKAPVKKPAPKKKMMTAAGPGDGDEDAGTPPSMRMQT